MATGFIIVVVGLGIIYAMRCLLQPIFETLIRSHNTLLQIRDELRKNRGEK